MRAVALTLIVAASFASPALAQRRQRQQRQLADIVLTNGKIFTSDFRRPYVQAIAIRGDRVLAVGTMAEIRLVMGPETREIPLQGRTVIPGINDAHVHLGAPDVGTEISVRGDDPSMRDVLEAVRSTARRLPDSAWIRGTLGLSALLDQRATRASLDREAPRNPVMLTAFTGHGMLLNSAAMRELGVVADSAEPMGGWAERDSSGAPSGLLFGYGQFALQRALAGRRSDSANVEIFRAGGEQALRYGITTLQLLSHDLRADAAVKAIVATEPLIRWRVIRAPMTDARGRRMRDERATPPRSPLITVGGVKWILDGTLVERNALLRSEYADRQGWFGRAYLPPDTVRQIVREAFTSRELLLLHAIGDSTIVGVLAAMNENGTFEQWQTRRLRLEHATMLSADLIPLAKRLGVVVVKNPTQIWRPAIPNARLARHMAPSYHLLKTLVRQGIPTGIGSDGPLNPFLGIMYLVTHPTNPTEALTVEQAVVAYTRGSAYAEGMEDRKGTLMPGMLADLAILSQDIFRTKPTDLPKTEAVLVMVGGKIVYER